MADIEALNESVMNTITDFFDEYSAVESVDYSTRCANLKPGTPVPAKGGVHITENRQHIDAYGYQAGEKIKAMCDEQRSGILESMSTPPSDDALRMMQTISLRGNSVTKTELCALADKYGDNYQVRRFVSDQMKERKLGGATEDPLDQQLKQIEHAQRVGEKNVKAYNLEEKNAIGRSSRLAMIKEQLYGTGIFAAF